MSRSNGFKPRTRRSALFLSVACLALAGAAQAAEQLKLVDASFMDVDAQLKGAEGHPNEQWRWNGLKAYLSGRYPEAIEDFERAASYADKHSQHFLSLIYWYGQGVPKDPVVAYIWSDLAAERGSRRLLAIREKMWAQLTPGQQAEVAARGADFYAKYGDEVARPKADAEIRRFASHMTGSRLGFNNKPMDVTGKPANGAMGVATSAALLASGTASNGGPDANHMYGEDRTALDAYWKEQDRELDNRKGSVDIGPLQRAPTKPGG